MDETRLHYRQKMSEDTSDFDLIRKFKNIPDRRFYSENQVGHSSDHDFRNLRTHTFAINLKGMVSAVHENLKK